MARQATRTIAEASVRHPFMHMALNRADGFIASSPCRQVGNSPIQVASILKPCASSLVSRTAAKRKHGGNTSQRDGAGRGLRDGYAYNVDFTIQGFVPTDIFKGEA